MKKNSVMFFAFSIIVLGAGAQKINAAVVPQAVKTAFAKQYPGVKAAWENENGQFEAAFKKEGKTMSVLYTGDGTKTESEVDIKVAQLPGAVIAYMKEHYKSAVIKEAAKITKADGTINYEAGISKMDVLFDAEGKFIKESKD